MVFLLFFELPNLVEREVWSFVPSLVKSFKTVGLYP
jgi:hypothetical protein